MDAMVIGIDVSKDRLDVAVRPTGESLIFKRTGVGIEDLIARLGAVSPFRSAVPIRKTCPTCRAAFATSRGTASVIGRNSN